MLSTCIIQARTIHFSPPMLLVKKNNDTWRLFVDYKKLNSIAVKDNYPIPLIYDFLDELGKAGIFCKIHFRA